MLPRRRAKNGSVTAGSAKSSSPAPLRKSPSASRRALWIAIALPSRAVPYIASTAIARTSARMGVASSAGGRRLLRDQPDRRHAGRAAIVDHLDHGGVRQALVGGEEHGAILASLEDRLEPLAEVIARDRGTVERQRSVGGDRQGQLTCVAGG